MAISLEKHKFACLAILTVLYAFGAILHASSKPLWYDEIFTVMAASAPDASSAWKAARILDASPPLPHLMTHFAMRFFGGGEVATRLPAIAGFWIYCLCLFWFVRRRLGIFFGLAALLLPLSTEAYQYAYEARAYGLELGFCALSLVCWQSAAESEKKAGRVAALVVLAGSLAAALMCHYYAIFVYLPLAGGEAYRTWKSRRIAWGIWLAMFAGSLPLIWRFATIRAVVSGFGATSWYDLNPIQILDYWNDGLQPALCLLVVALVAAVLSGRKTQGSPQDAQEPRSLPPHELLAGLLFLVIPGLVLAVGILATKVYASRYALIGLTGVALLLPAVVAKLARGRSLPAFLLLAIAGLRLFFVIGTVPPHRDVVAEEAVFVAALKQGPVVVADGQLFMQMWHYLPAPLKANMIFLVDSEASVKYQSFNTAAINAALSGVRASYPLPVIDYKTFATPGREFRVLQNPLKPGWLLEKIAADGGEEVIDRYTNLRQLYRVRIK